MGGRIEDAHGAMYRPPLVFGQAPMTVSCTVACQVHACTLACLFVLLGSSCLNHLCVACSWSCLRVECFLRQIFFCTVYVCIVCVPSFGCCLVPLTCRLFPFSRLRAGCFLVAFTCRMLLALFACRVLSCTGYALGACLHQDKYHFKEIIVQRCLVLFMCRVLVLLSASLLYFAACRVVYAPDVFGTVYVSGAVGVVAIFLVVSRTAYVSCGFLYHMRARAQEVVLREL